MNKSELRKLLLNERKSITGKAEKDSGVYDNLISFEPFIEAETVLVYLSSESEVNTDKIISYCFDNGKRVAVPFCTDSDGNMEFYIIKSFNALSPGHYGIREPDIKSCEKLSDFSASIIVVPGLSFDKNGNRLGYGKGYYDRFLKNYSFISVGLCYNSFIKDIIPSENYDVKVNYIITEDAVLDTHSGGKNG